MADHSTKNGRLELIARSLWLAGMGLWDDVPLPTPHEISVWIETGASIPEQRSEDVS